MAIPEIQATQRAIRTDNKLDDLGILARMKQQGDSSMGAGGPPMPVEPPMGDGGPPMPVEPPMGDGGPPIGAGGPPMGAGGLPMPIPTEPPKTLNTMLKKIATEIGLPNLINKAISPEVKEEIEKKEERENQAALQQKATEDNAIMLAMQRYSQDQNAATESGGLIGMAAGGRFSGQVPGEGHGMEDNVYMPIVQRKEGNQVGTLAVSPDEYVVDAHTMSALGNGSADAGANVMDQVVEGVREKAYGTDKQPNQINGLAALRPMIERV